VAINAIFKGPEFEERVDIEGLRLFNEAIDLHRPGAGRKHASILRGLILLDTKLVIVVIGGEVFEAG
jgi:hypothetical protein